MTVTLQGVVIGSNVALAAGSEVCFPDASLACYPRTGMITAATFSTACPPTDVDVSGCALTLIGSVHASASWGGGSLRLDLAIAHQDEIPNATCSVTEGS